MASPEPAWQRPDYRPAVAEALRALGVTRLVVAIHDASFPRARDGRDGDVGRGTPYSAAGQAFFGFARALGFTGVQLGPQGWIARANPSPYDAMLFSRNPLSIALGELAVDVEGSDAPFTEHARAFDRQAAALGQLWHARGADWAADVERFARAAGDWLARDERTADQPPARYRFEQWLAHRQHAELRAHARKLGLMLYGDLQIGVSHRDRQALAPLFLDGYAMGAPPSRTNPEGQPWGYPLFDPAQHDGAAGALFTARIDKLGDEYDALRVDHPHGLVDPWVYRPPPTGSDEAAACAAVRAGARLFSSPDLPDHPLLARFAIARAAALDRARRRWDDDWVRALDEAEVDRYGGLFARLCARVRARGGHVDELTCEVLSTLPYPLARVLGREGLGRMRVTQKARLDDPADVYRSENAQPRDWVMVGNHDTPPIWRLVDEWHGTAAAARRAEALAARLEPAPAARPALAARLAASRGQLATAMFAELFASPAAHVSIFFADLFGYREIYNRPGTVSDENWRLRVAADYAERYAADCADGDEPRALHLPRAVALALRADEHRRREHAPLLARLDALADDDAGAMR
jgi:hypothetical protein